MEFDESVEFERTGIAAADFEQHDVPRGPDAWSADDDLDADAADSSYESDSGEEDNGVEGEIFVDEFIWPVINMFALQQFNPSLPEFAKFQEAICVRDGSFVYRLGYLGVTYDADAIAHLVDADDEFIVSARNLGDMLRILRDIYFIHNEEDAVRNIDGFLGIMGGHLLRNERLSWVSS